MERPEEVRALDEWSRDYDQRLVEEWLHEMEVTGHGSIAIATIVLAFHWNGQIMVRTEKGVRLMCHRLPEETANCDHDWVRFMTELNSEKERSNMGNEQATEPGKDKGADKKQRMSLREKWDQWLDNVCDRRERSIMAVVSRLKNLTKSVIEIGQEGKRTGWSNAGLVEQDVLADFKRYYAELYTLVKKFVEDTSSPGAKPDGQPGSRDTQPSNSAAPSTVPAPIETLRTESAPERGVRDIL